MILLNIPRGKPLPGTEGPNMPYTLVGDEAFPLSNKVMRPYSGKVLAEKKGFSTTVCLGPADMLKVPSAYSQINGKFSTRP